MTHKKIAFCKKKSINKKKSHISDFIRVRKKATRRYTRPRIAIKENFNNKKQRQALKIIYS